MTEEMLLLCGTAATIGLVHTVLGPDHYLPFVAMSRIGRWPLRKTVLVTVLCGIGHVLSSVALGLIGIALGLAVFKLESIESWRGDVAGWLLLAFGLVYFVWGVRRAIRNRPHTHKHIHVDGTAHAHEHAHADEHVHVHKPSDAPGGEARTANTMTPWILFTIFVFGPCEPLIPILMYPAAKGRMVDVLLVTAIFGLTTLLTMTTIVVGASMGMASLSLGRLERYGHALAGFVVLACGAAIKAGL